MVRKPKTAKRGCRRPLFRGGPSKVVAVSLPGALADDLDAYCKENRALKSAVVAEAIMVLLSAKKQ